MTKRISATKAIGGFCLALALFIAIPQAFAALSDQYFDCILNNENRGGTPATKNKFGYLGNYQVGVPAMADAGICSKPVPMNNKWENCDFNGPLAKKLGLTGTWAERYAQFTTGPYAADIQRQAAEAYTEANWNYVKNDLKSKGLNIDDYIGKTINGVTMTRESILAMAHLLGHSGAANFLASGKDGKDGFGTSASGYAACLSQCMTGGGDGKCKFKIESVCGDA